MDQNKKELIDFLLEKEVLKFGDFTLKSGRPSPYFINIGDMNDGKALTVLGDEFAKVMSSLEGKVNVLFGPAYKGIPIAVATSIALNKMGVEVGYACDRKEVKDHGEATGADLQKKAMMGRTIQDENRIVIVEDVITTGATKYEALDLLNKSAKGLEFPALVIAVDRQEVDAFGRSSAGELTKQTGIPIRAILTALDIYEYLKEKGDPNAERMEKYFSFYGTQEVKRFGRRLEEQTIIPRNKSVIVACDVSTLEELEKIALATGDIEKIGGYKIGFELGLGYGLAKVVETIRKHTDKPIIYDHQKAGTDIPATGMNFARVMKKSGIESIILFPQAGPETEKAWIYHATDAGLKVIVGGPMTHPGYKESEGGYLSDENGVLRMISVAADLGVNNFVAPGTKLDDFKRVRETVEEYGVKNPTFYAPGFITQGGTIEEAGRVAGDRWHAIVGSGIYQASDMRKAALDHTSQI